MSSAAKSHNTANGKTAEPQPKRRRVVCAASVQAANFHLNGDLIPVLSNVLGFATGPDDYLDIILVSKQWKRVADHDCLKEIAILRKMENKSRITATMRKEDVCYLAVLLECMGNSKSPLYRARRRRRRKTPYQTKHALDVEKWPLLDFRAHAILSAFVCEMLQVHVKGRNNHRYLIETHALMYDVVGPYFDALAVETVQRMAEAAGSRLVSNSGDDTTTASTTNAVLKSILEAWYRWTGIVKIVGTLSRYIDKCKYFRRPRPELKELSETAMQKAMSEFNLATKQEIINLITATTTTEHKNGNDDSDRLPLQELEQVMAYLQPVVVDDDEQQQQPS